MILCYQLGAIEGQNALKNNIKVDLSAQEIVDCPKTDYTLGCQGGLVDAAYKYVKSNGIASAKSYPYVGKDGTCQRNGSERVNVTLTGWVDLEPHESDLQSAVGK